MQCGGIECVVKDRKIVNDRNYSFTLLQKREINEFVSRARYFMAHHNCANEKLFWYLQPVLSNSYLPGPETTSIK